MMIFRSWQVLTKAPLFIGFLKKNMARKKEVKHLALTKIVLSFNSVN